MATITDRARGKTTGPGRSLVLSAIRVQLGTRTEAISAANFGLRTLYQIHPVPPALGGSSGTIVYVPIRNVGSNNARASVTAWRIAATSTGAIGTLGVDRLVAGTVTVELLGIGE